MLRVHRGISKMCVLVGHWQEEKKAVSIESASKMNKQNTMFFVIERHFKLFEGQQCLPGLNLWNNTNINPKNNEIIYQLIKKLNW